MPHQFLPSIYTFAPLQFTTSSYKSNRPIPISISFIFPTYQTPTTAVTMASHACAQRPPITVDYTPQGPPRDSGWSEDLYVLFRDLHTLLTLNTQRQDANATPRVIYRHRRPRRRNKGHHHRLRYLWRLAPDRPGRRRPLPRFLRG